MIRRSKQIPRRAPRWLGYANRLNVALLSRGMGPSSQRLLTIPGRKTGLPRTTPIATVGLADKRYIVAGYPDSDWVRNARAAGRGVVHRGTSRCQVELVELSADRGVAVLREFLRTVRGGRSFVSVRANATDADFAAAAVDHPVFLLRSFPGDT